MFRQTLSGLDLFGLLLTNLHLTSFLPPAPIKSGLKRQGVLETVCFSTSCSLNPYFQEPKLSLQSLEVLDQAPVISPIICSFFSVSYLHIDNLDICTMQKELRGNEKAPLHPCKAE